MKDIELLSKEAVQSGWYLNDVMLIGLPSRIDNYKDLDSVMIDMIEESWEGLWSDVFAASKIRTEILREAKICHEQGLYAASIHILLSQTDGFFKDKFQNSFYKNQGKTAKCKLVDILSQKIEIKSTEKYEDLNYLELANLFFFKSYVATISEVKMDVTRNIDTHEDVSSFTIPNRHSVLHGMHTNYVSKVNSIKCFSLLLFVIATITDDKLIGI